MISRIIHGDQLGIELSFALHNVLTLLHTQKLIQVIILYSIYTTLLAILFVGS
jgi:hypothetical protein